MDDLITFLTARLDEDEAAAKAAWGVEWDWRYVARPFGERPSIAHTVHIARHDPARVLREVAAKRALMAEHAAVKDHGRFSGEEDRQECSEFCAHGEDDWVCRSCRDYAGNPLDAPCDVVRHLAAIDSNHPDYRPDWAVTEPLAR